MSFALWTILAAAFLPLLCAGLAKFGGSGYDNNAPRASLDALRGWRARADGAQRNHVEAFGPFAAGVLTATVAHAPSGIVDLLAGAFILLRILYAIVYVIGWGTLRSIVWALGLACVIGLFCAGLR